MLKPLIALTTALSIFVCALASTASAATVERMDLDELVQRSDAVVVAQVADVQTELDERGRVVSIIELRVRETLKGPATQTVKIRQIGGAHGNIVTRVPGMPSFQVADQGVLFLSGDVELRPTAVTGLAQGYFRVALGPDNATEFAIPQINSMNLVVRERTQPTPGTSQLRSVSAADLHLQVHELDAFKAQIRALVDSQAREEQ